MVLLMQKSCIEKRVITILKEKAELERTEDSKTVRKFIRMSEYKKVGVGPF